jgi:formylmethanofuran dehydrogenase subunit E
MAGKKNKLVQPSLKFEYLCSKCTNIAIKTSNKMLGVKVVCESCKEEIELNNVKNYKKIK